MSEFSGARSLQAKQTGPEGDYGRVPDLLVERHWPRERFLEAESRSLFPTSVQEDEENER